MNNVFSKIIGTGSYLPKKVCDNEELSYTLDTNSEWIITRTGIRSRHFAADSEMCSDLALHASAQALKNAGVDASEIDIIVVATTTPDLTFPSTAAILQSKLKCSNAFAFDIQAVCSGFVYAISVANNFIKLGQACTVLVVGSEVMSRIVDWTDRESCILFGDGAGAVVLQRSENPGILATKLYSDGNLRDILYTSGGISSNGRAGYIKMLGRIVYGHAVEKLSAIVLDILADNKLSIEDVDYFIPHQANIRIINSVSERIGLSPDKVIITVDKHANTSAASIPLALDASKSFLRTGDKILMAAIGGGLTWGAALMLY